jgi:hypothetical protein
MDWRLISAVTLASASFSMVAFGAYTLRAADGVPSGAGRAASPLLAPSLMPPDAGAGTVQPERGVSYMPVAPSVGVSAEVPALSGVQMAAVQMAAVDGASPVPVADLPVLQDKAARPSNLSMTWQHRHHVTWKVGHRARFSTVLQPCGTDRKQQVAVRHTEPHSAPKIALMLGVGF